MKNDALPYLSSQHPHPSAPDLLIASSVLVRATGPGGTGGRRQPRGGGRSGARPGHVHKHQAGLKGRSLGIFKDSLRIWMMSLDEFR